MTRKSAQVELAPARLGKPLPILKPGSVDHANLGLRTSGLMIIVARNHRRQLPAAVAPRQG